MLYHKEEEKHEDNHITQGTAGPGARQKATKGKDTLSATPIFSEALSLLL